MTIPLETVFAQAHALPGEPHARVSGVLTSLEGGDWATLLHGEDALAAQLAAVLGRGLIRVDPRLPLSREVFAGHGLALGSSEGEWRGALAVWLMEPDEAAFRRARRADVPVLVDATLSPGGLWFSQGAQFVTYRDSVTLTGFSDAPFAALLGSGEQPQRSAPAPADLSLALALRDLSTLALRMNRRTRNGESVIARLAQAGVGFVLPISGGLLLLEHDHPRTASALGGNLSAARAVAAGTLVSVGIENVDDAWITLSGVLGLDGTAQDGASQDGVSQDRGAQDTPADETRPDQASARQGSIWQNGTPQDRQAPERQLQDRQPQDRPQQERPQQERPRQERPRQERAPQLAPVPAAQPSAFQAPGIQAPDSQPPVLQAPAIQPEITEPQAAQSEPAPDFNDREFVFTPLPTPPAPDQERPTQPVFPAPTRPEHAGDGQAEAQPDAGRGRRNRGRRRGGAEQQAAQDGGPDTNLSTGRDDRDRGGEQAPEIVFSDSPPQREAPRATGTDRWPEETAQAEDEVEATNEAASTEPEAETAPLLAPDLPNPAEGAADPAADLTDEQQAIYARLREWRNAEAKRQTVSRFIIASNATLAEIARRVPYTQDDLKSVRGMGPARLERYGQKLLEVVRG